MTDTNEPKYKVGDIVEVDQGDIHWIGRVTGLGLNSVFLSTGINANDDDENLEFDLSMIRSKVAIYELPDKPVYCNDCEMTFEVDANSMLDKPYITVYKDDCIKMTIFVREGKNRFPVCYPDNQPPPNCHCYKERAK